MARKEKGLVSRIVSFLISWIISILVSILISIWKFFRKKTRGEGNEGWCGSTYKYTYNLTYKYLGFFRRGRGTCGRGRWEEVVEGLWFFLGFSWAFAPVANS